MAANPLSERVASEVLVMAYQELGQAMSQPTQTLPMLHALCDEETWVETSSNPSKYSFLR